MAKWVVVAAILVVYGVVLIVGGRTSNPQTHHTGTTKWEHAYATNCP